MPRAGERVSSAHGKIPGTPLDRRVRVTGETLTSLMKVLQRTEDSLAKTIEVREAEIADLRVRIAEAKKAYDEAFAEKCEKEPNTYTVPGLTTNRGVPPGVTPEEWVKLRKSGEYKRYLGLVNE